MRKIFVPAFALVLLAGVSASSVFAQGPGGPPAGAQGGGMNGGQGGGMNGGQGGGQGTGQGGAMNRPAGAPQQVDLATAKKMAAAAEAAATGMNQHIAICIMDVRGDMVLFERGDTINAIPVNSSQGKAHAVLMFGVSTKQLAAAIKAGTPVPLLKAPATGYAEMDIREGGLPIMKNGKMVGAIGVGGSATEDDEKFAQAGIDAVK